MTPQRALAHARRGATLAVAAATFLGLGGCAAELGSMAPNNEMLLPHSVLLKPPPLDRGTFDVAVTRPSAASSTAGATNASLTITEQPEGFSGSDALVLSQWGPPTNRSDSLVVNRASLEPLRETYVSHGIRYDYHFDGPQVQGTIDRPDAAPRHVHDSFDEPVFALNEIGPLVRSIAYQPGMTEIVPLFSETSGKLQHDTLSVLRHATPADHAPEWIVRFADPAVTTDYTVNASTHRIVDAVTTQRASGEETHYQYPGAPIATG